MKYSAHKVNIRTIRSMAVGETIMLKHGKRVQYKGGYTISPDSYREVGWLTADETMSAVRDWTKAFDGCKATVIIVKRTDEHVYDACIAEHYSTTNSLEYKFLTEQMGHKLIKV